MGDTFKYYVYSIRNENSVNIYLKRLSVAVVNIDSKAPLHIYFILSVSICCYIPKKRI